MFTVRKLIEQSYISELAVGIREMNLPTIILLTNAAATLFMTGVIWLVQLVHYPLMANVGEAGYREYQQLHEKWITWVVGPPMLIEIVTAVLLLIYGSNQIEPWKIWTGIGLVGVIWLSTALLQVPCHSSLSDGFNAAAHSQLVSSNWIRTIAWTLRSALVGWMVYDLVTPK
jgi:uncharacterized membrane protein